MKRFKDLFKFNRKSVLISLISSYILILAVSLGVYFIAYNISKNVLKKEIESNYQYSLNQLKLVMDQKMLDIENIGTEMSINKNLQTILPQTYPLDDYDNYKMLQIMTELHNWRVVNTFVEDIDLYLPNSDLIVSDSSTYNYNDWYNIYYKNINGMGKDEFKNYLSGYHSKDYAPMSKLNSSGNEFEFISYIHSIAINSNKESNGTLFISIKESFIKEFLNSYDFISQNGNAFIIDNKDNIISAKDNFRLPENLNYKYISSQKRFFDTKINNKKYVIVDLKSDRTKWIYCFALPYSVFFQRLDILSTISVISMCFCLLLGILIMYYSARKNYTPIEGIIKFFSKLDGINAESSNDEYEYIQSVINNIMLEREKMYSMIDSSKLELKNNFLVKLLKGRLEDENTFTALCTQYNLNFNNERFAVMLIDTQHIEEINFETDSSDDKASSIEILQFIIKNTFEEQINMKNIGCVVEFDNKSACIINAKIDNETEFEKEILRIADEGQKNISLQYGIDIFISISSIHNSFKEIATAYNEAAQTMQYQSLIGDGGILDYKSTSNYSDALIVSDFENNNKLKSYIESGDFSKAREVIKNIFENGFYDKKNSVYFYLVKAKMYELVNLIIESMYDLTAKYDYNFFENINPEKKFIKCDNLAKLWKEMDSILAYADSYIKARHGTKNDNLLQKIMSFINLNYSDNNLSVSMISERFGLTVPYLSKLFKKKTGTGLLDYIHSVRIEHSKELLKDKNLHIKEVAEMSGYYNAVAFIRVFKKFEGISPGKYSKNKTLD